MGSTPTVTNFLTFFPCDNIRAAAVQPSEGLCSHIHAELQPHCLVNQLRVHCIALLQRTKPPREASLPQLLVTSWGHFRADCEVQWCSGTAAVVASLLGMRVLDGRGRALFDAPCSLCSAPQKEDCSGKEKNRTTSSPKISVAP